LDQNLFADGLAATRDGDPERGGEALQSAQEIQEAAQTNAPRDGPVTRKCRLRGHRGLTPRAHDRSARS
jgi:hypothetical protein